MKKGLKLFLLTSTALITNTSIASALTSCSSKDIIFDIGGLDKNYGITMATYNRMESDLKDLYETQQNTNKDKGFISEQEYQANLLSFKSKLNSFHANLFSENNKFLSYTVKTNALKEFADYNYEIKLSRVTNINLNDELADIKASMLSSLFVYIDSYKVDNSQAIEIIEKANSQFDELKNDALRSVGSNDNVAIILYVQNRMINCFEGICDEINVLVAQQKLKDFLDEYEINVQGVLNKEYCWNNLYAKYGAGNKEIELDDFNGIFTISPKSGPLKGSVSSLQKDFDNDLIPGYTLKPIIHSMNADPYKNEYSIDVDYTLIKNEYLDKDDAARYTVHSALLEDESIYQDDNISVFDINTIEGERNYTKYDLPITLQYEHDQIIDTFFDGDFTFSWSNDRKYGFDNFWVEANKNNQYIGEFDKFALANTGMMVNGYLLSDLIEETNTKEDINLLQIDKQEAINFVKYVNFNLNFTEIDENTVIMVNDIIVNYDNSLYKFNNLSDEFKNQIFIAINDESTVTDHASLNFFTNVKNDYDSVAKLASTDELRGDIVSLSKESNIFDAILLALTAILLPLTFLAVVTGFIEVKKNWNGSKWNNFKLICSLLGKIGGLIGAIYGIYSHNQNIQHGTENVISKLDNIEEKSQLKRNIKNDQKYFVNNDHFPDTMSVEEMRRLKLYYSSSYINDLTEFYSGKDSMESMRESMEIDIIYVMKNVLWQIIVLTALIALIGWIFFCLKWDET